jgi:hypothetical protein
MKNYTTPRTLADSEFRTGYPAAHYHRQEDRHRARGNMAAVLIGATVVFILFIALSGV